MGACAIYTAVRAAIEPSLDALVPIVRPHEHVTVASQPGNLASMRMGETPVAPDLPRQALGRLAVMDLALHHVGDAERDAIAGLVEAGVWWMFTPGALEDPLRTVDRLLARAGRPPVGSLAWPTSPVLACLVGAPPAVVLGTAHHIAFVPATAVAAAVGELATRASAHDRYGADEVWRAFLRDTAARGDALAIHWAHR